jgi:hypothetical protein
MEDRCRVGVGSEACRNTVNYHIQSTESFPSQTVFRLYGRSRIGSVYDRCDPALSRVEGAGGGEERKELELED